MKILMISNMYPSNKYPNYGVFVKNFEESLKDKNIDVQKIIMTKTIYKSIKVLKYLIHYFKIIFNILIQRYDLIYVHYVSHNAIPILIANKFRKIKLFSNLHGTDLIPQRKEQEKFKVYTEKILQISDKIIVPSEFFKTEVNSIYNIDKERIIVYPSGGINTKKFFLLSEEEKYKFKYKNGINLETKIIGYVGRIDIKKGWDIFLEGIKILVDDNKIEKASVVMVGNGNEINQLRSMIKEYHLNEYIVYFDLLPQEELVNIYNIIDVFIFPTFQESLGLVGLEAMYCKCAIIASDIEVIRGYIEDNKEGYLFPKGDYLMMSEEIISILNKSHEDIEILKINARRRAEQYIDNKVNRDLVNFITSVNIIL